MKKSFVLSSKILSISLRTVSKLDCEELRQWKNANRFSFFSQEVISPEQQETWFNKYLERENDFLFMVMEATYKVGCLGYRMLGRSADIYNVIRNTSESQGRGRMSRALRVLCSFVWFTETHDIRLKVLASNSARVWYTKNGFQEVECRSNYAELKLDEEGFQPCDYEVQCVED